MSRVQPTFDAIVHAHRIVREATATVLRSEDADEIHASLARLAEILPGHFQAEERPDGFFEHLRRVLHGHAEKEVGALLSEHRALEQALPPLVAATDKGPAWREEVRRFARLLQEHERREARLGAAPAEVP